MTCIHGGTKEDCKKCRNRLPAELVYKKEPLGKRPKELGESDYMEMSRLLQAIK